MQVVPTILEDAIVRLRPLAEADVDALTAIGIDPAIWEWVPTPVRTREDMQRYVANALAEQAKGSACPFVIEDVAHGAVVGCTRYGAIEPQHRRLEIGWTWIEPPFQRTPINTHAKWLLLRHAFEELGAHRVELKTDALNARSRAAILRLGAKEEGVLRKHVITASGRIRDTVYYSILDTEWPEVRAGLLARL
jgi:N-acetyltransferase